MASKNKKWHINQCDHCSNFEPKRYCTAGSGSYLNLNEETNKICSNFKPVLKYNEDQFCYQLLQDYCLKNKMSILEKNKFFWNLDDNKQKCIELNLIKGLDEKTINNIGNINLPNINEINYRETDEYKLWHKEVLKRDNYQCQICGSNKELHVHHLDSFSKYPEFRYVVDNGITLCFKHHDIQYPGSFHNVYGTRNFTREDFIMYKNNQTEGI